MVSNKLAEKYGEALKIKTVNKTKPMIKIPKIFTNETHQDVILAQLVDQNPILKNIKIDIEQFYETSTYRDEKYRCLMIAVDLASHAKILKKGFFHFNISEMKI